MIVTGVAWDDFMNDIRSRHMTFIIVTFMNDMILWATLDLET